MNSICVFCGKEIEYDVYRGRAFPIKVLDKMRSSLIHTHYMKALNIIKSKSNVITFHWYCDKHERPVNIANVHLREDQYSDVKFLYDLYTEFKDKRKEVKK